MYPLQGDTFVSGYKMPQYFRDTKIYSIVGMWAKYKIDAAIVRKSVHVIALL